MARILEEAEYGVVEGFVFDYKTHAWYKFSREKPNPQLSSYSDMLRLDLNAFL